MYVLCCIHFLKYAQICIMHCTFFSSVNEFTISTSFTDPITHNIEMDCSRESLQTQKDNSSYSDIGNQVDLNHSGATGSENMGSSSWFVL